MTSAPYPVGKVFVQKLANYMATQRKLVACSHGNTDSYTKSGGVHLLCSTHHTIHICLSLKEDYCHERSGKCGACTMSTANTDFCVPLYKKG